MCHSNRRTCRTGIPNCRCATEPFAGALAPLFNLSPDRVNSHGVPLDLNALIPIPRRVLRKGFAEAGQEWMWANWGLRRPIRRVSFTMERDRRVASGVKTLAVFSFLSEDWSPWIALLRMRERWPELSFRLIPSYLDMA